MTQIAVDALPPPHRWAIGVEYIGTGYSGWQALKTNKSIQATLEWAVSRVADQPVTVTAAGRTDAGVHALQQVAHFDATAQRSAYAWLLGINSNLPADVSVRWIQQPAGQNAAKFHARFSAQARAYRYVIHNSRSRSALFYGRATRWPLPLDADAMNRAAQCLTGEHDFSSFRDSECQSPTAMRNLHRVEVHRIRDCVVLDVSGNAFLHHMVRNITGTLVEVGLGRRPKDWVREVLEARDRRRAGMTAPPEGLYFIGPRYPAEFALPEPPDPGFPG